MADWFKEHIFSAAGDLINGWGWLSGRASAAIINRAVTATRNRPHPFSTLHDYTSWDGLTDRTYQARHLPPMHAPEQPSPDEIRKLFTRSGGQQLLSTKSTCLFPAFAQYLTDGFIRTMPEDRRRTTTNHEIDMCQLYGRTAQQTRALRQMSAASGERGRLKSQKINGEEYSPFLFGNGEQLSDDAFHQLDWPLMRVGQPTAAPGAPTPPNDLTAEARQTIFAVGGDRVNSTPFTAMMNTLFLREHNRLAGELEQRNPGWDDERVFQTARNIVIVLFIKVVVEDYINHITPLPFGLRADPSVVWHANWNRPNWITAEFSLLYRWHSLIPDAITWSHPAIPTANFGLNNRPLLDFGLDAAFSATAHQKAAALGAFNTAAALLPIEDLAVRQARTNQLATYNSYREAFGMARAETFADISTDPNVIALLGALYSSPDHVEFYPGLFAEDRVDDSPLPGLLLSMVAVDAFSQALTNPLLSEHVFNAATFSPWGFDLLQEPGKIADILARNVPQRGDTPIEMTQAGWRYGA